MSARRGSLDRGGTNSAGTNFSLPASHSACSAILNILGDIDAAAVAAGMATAVDEPPEFRKAIAAANAAVLYVSLKVCAEAVATCLARSADIAAGPTISRV